MADAFVFNYAGNKVQTELVSNTHQCLAECEMVIKVNMSKSLLFSPSMLSVRAVGGAEVSNVRIDYLSYADEDVQEVSGIEDVAVGNATVQVHHYTNTTIRVSSYVPIASMLIPAGEDVHIRISGSKRPLLGENNVDLVPTLLLHDLPYAWWNSSWSYRRPLFANQSWGSDLVDFQFLANGTAFINTQSLITAGKMQGDCDDIRILSNDSAGATELDWHFENETSLTYGCNTTKTVIWVKSGNLTRYNATHWLYYGNPSVDEASSENESAVWQSYLFRLGFGEESGTYALDSTLNNYDFRVNNGATWNCSGSFFGCAVYLDGTNDNLSGGDWGDPLTNYTIDLFMIRNSDPADHEMILVKGNSATCTIFAPYVQLVDGSPESWNIGHQSGGATVNNYLLRSTISSPTNIKQYVSSKWNGLDFTLTVNDTSITGQDSGGDNSADNTNHVWTIGDCGSREANMNIDEVRVYKGFREAGWTARSYHQELSSLGAEEAASAPSAVCGTFTDGYCAAGPECSPVDVQSFLGACWT